ncbi:MAG: two-component regulator propeller domain-containing protein [Bacteroidota bacterium]
MFILLGIIPTGFYPSVQAQKPDFLFDHLQTNDGLPTGYVNDIHQDERGFLWLCTWEGLIRYDGYNFVSYRPELGDSSSISSKYVYCMTGAPKGGLWIGTKKGLNYFDKNSGTFQRFLHEPGNPQSLPGDWVLDLLIDQAGNLWVACDKGLTKIILNEQGKPQEFLQFLPRQNDRSSLPLAQIMSILIDHKEQVWIGTMEGLAVIDTQGNVSRLPIRLEDGHEPQPSITALYEDQNQNIWIGTKGSEVFQWQSKTETFHKLEGIEPSNQYISDFCEDLEGNLWLSIYEKGLVVKSVTGELEQIRYHSESPQSLSSDAIKVLFRDQSGIIWIGGAGLGLDKFDPYRKPFRYYKHQSNNPGSLRHNKIMSIAEDPLGRMWMGTHDGGIEVFYPKENRFVRYENQTGSINPLISDKIWCLYADSTSGTMWAGGHYGLIRINLLTEQQSEQRVWIEGDLSSQFVPILLADSTLDPEKHQVRAILKDQTGMMWVGTYHGLFGLQIFKDSVEIAHHYLHDPDDLHSISDDIVISIFQDSQGDLWLGTRDGGLNRLRMSEGNPTGEFSRYNNHAKNHSPNSFKGREVSCILEDRHQNLWFGTNGDGLNVLRRTNRQDGQADFQHFGKKEGLLGDAVFGILDDHEGYLWLSTNQGLFKFDPKLPNGQQFQQFTIEHGLSSNMFFTGSYCKSKSGHLYFGSQTGFNVFHPDSILENPYSPKVVISQLEIFNEVVSVGEKRNRRVVLNHPISEATEISLSYLDNNFQLEFAALSFSSPENNKYAYQLEGYDEDWIYTDASRRIASYNNLKPGTYTFKVKASNADHIWNELPSQLIIHTATPPWKSLWAIGIYGLILLGFLYLFRAYMINKIRLTNDLELQHREHQKEKQINQLKLHFFTQISHEFRTPLTLIIGPVRNLIQKGNELSKSEISRNVNLIDFNVRYVMRLIDQLLYFNKSESGKLHLQNETGDLIEFVRQSCESFLFVAEKNKIDLHFEADREELRLKLDWDKVLKILNNLISNALKFTPKGGEVCVSIRLESEDSDDCSQTPVRIEVKDNGIGIPADELALIFDSFYQVGSTRTDSQTGYGIGLALTKKLVEIQQGTIEVESDQKFGTRFCVSLPYHPPCALLIDKENHKWTEPWSLPGMGADMNANLMPEVLLTDEKEDSRPIILIVEDHPEIRTFLLQNLCQSYRILVAENGEEAWETVLANIPTLIISDIMMPVMDGLQLCEKIKQDERTSHIPVILLTAKSAIEHRIVGIESGADAYLAKPFHPRFLQAKIEQLIQVRSELRKKYQGHTLMLESNPAISSSDEPFLNRVKEIIEAHLSDTEFKVGELERELGMSHMQLYRKLKALIDQSANEFIRTVRLQHAAKLLMSTQLNVNEVSYRVGFNSPSYFIKCFRKQFKILPKAYAEQQRMRKGNERSLGLGARTNITMEGDAGSPVPS